MRLTEAAARAARKSFCALLDLRAHDLLVLAEKRFTQHHRVTQFYGEVLRDLSQAQEPLKLPKELTDLLTAAN
jgi:hypothetical protein